MKPYVPDPLPLKTLERGRLIRKVGPASVAIARYDGLLQSVVNPSVMLSRLTSQEAVLSSRIEGTQATVDEVLEYEAGIEFDPEKTRDIQEVVNYRKTLTLASESLKKEPITLFLIKQMHGILTDQNLIGVEGCTMETALFVPPAPLQLPDHLEAFERYLDGDDIDVLIQCAIVHAQFEILHPFKDGNGRIGRLLIPLFLFQKGALASPMFYLSEYLEENRERYYQRLRAIGTEDGWTCWVEFFLEAVRQQALTNTERGKGILGLYDEMKQRIVDLTHSQYAIKILDTLFDRSTFSSSDFIKRLGIPRNTAMPLLKTLRDEKILITIQESSGSRPAILAFRELLNCTEGREVF